MRAVRAHSMITYRLQIILLIVLATVSSIVAAQTDHVAVDKAIYGFEKALPQGWTVIERQFDAIPYGHHFCDDYNGLKGTKLIVIGPDPVQVVWTSLSGETISTTLAKESLELWFMPPNYRDSQTAWLCLHRPIQPIAILEDPSIIIFGRPSHQLNSKTAWLKLLTKAQAISWPESPANDRSKISWSNWEQDIRLAVQKWLQK